MVANLLLNNKKDYKNPSYRRSDHPSFQEKRHNLLIDAQGASNKTIATESGKLKFENGVAVLPNDERARDIVDELNGTDDPDIRALHPDQYALVEDKMTVNTDPTHRYTFGWNRTYEQAYEKLFGGSEDDTETSEEETHDRQDQSGRGGDALSGTN